MAKCKALTGSAMTGLNVEHPRSCKSLRLFVVFVVEHILL